MANATSRSVDCGLVFAHSTDQKLWRIIDAETNAPARNQHGDVLDGEGIDNPLFAGATARSINARHGFSGDKSKWARQSYARHILAARKDTLPNATPRPQANARNETNPKDTAAQEAPTDTGAGLGSHPAKSLTRSESQEQRANGKRPKVSKEEANIQARALLEQKPRPGKKRWSIRPLAEAIGCSEGLISHLPAWRAYYDNDSVAKGTGVVRLTDSLLATQGRPDEELQRLIEQQESDREPSPLEPGQYQVRVNKKL